MIGECMPRHRHQEFLRFLRRLDREFPEETPLHLVLDNYRDPHRAQRAGMAGQAPSVHPPLHPYEFVRG